MMQGNHVQQILSHVTFDNIQNNLNDLNDYRRALLLLFFLTSYNFRVKNNQNIH